MKFYKKSLFGESYPDLVVKYDNGDIEFYTVAEDKKGRAQTLRVQWYTGPIVNVHRDYYEISQAEFTAHFL